MTESSKKLGANEPFHNVLVAVDLTAISDRVLGRVALLPLAEGARVTLLHVVPSGLPARARDRAEKDAMKTLTEEADHIASALPPGVSITKVVKVGSSAAEIVACAAAKKVDLVVMGRGNNRALRDTFLGSTAERVMRNGQLPVLAVRQAPRAVYRQPAVAVDLRPGSSDVLAWTMRLLPRPRPRVMTIHAFDTPYRGLIYSSLAEEDAEEWRNELGNEVTQQLTQLLAIALKQAKVSQEEAPRWKSHVRCGSARLVIANAVKRASSDLLVLGTAGHSGPARILLGTVAGDVLREVECDVLVVPVKRSLKDLE